MDRLATKGVLGLVAASACLLASACKYGTYDGVQPQADGGVIYAFDTAVVNPSDDVLLVVSQANVGTSAGGGTGEFSIHFQPGTFSEKTTVTVRSSGQGGTVLGGNINTPTWEVKATPDLPLRKPATAYYFIGGGDPNSNANNPANGVVRIEPGGGASFLPIGGVAKSSNNPGSTYYAQFGVTDKLGTFGRVTSFGNGNSGGQVLAGGVTTPDCAQKCGCAQGFGFLGQATCLCMGTVDPTCIEKNCTDLSSARVTCQARVRCATGECAPDQVCCADPDTGIQGKAHCAPAGGCNGKPLAYFECLGQSDCQAGQTCCGVNNNVNGGQQYSACHSGPGCPPGAVLCKNASECATCSPKVVNCPAVCRVSPDAGSIDTGSCF